MGWPIHSTPNFKRIPYRVREVVLVDLGLHLGVGERPLQHEEVDRERCRCLGLQDQLI